MPTQLFTAGSKMQSETLHDTEHRRDSRQIAVAGTKWLEVEPLGGYCGLGSTLEAFFAASAMGLFYILVVRAASGSWIHLANQARQDWYYLVAIVLG